jgi:hypothetical protein
MIPSWATSDWEVTLLMRKRQQKKVNKEGTFSFKDSNKKTTIICN